MRFATTCAIRSFTTIVRVVRNSYCNAVHVVSSIRTDGFRALQLGGRVRTIGADSATATLNSSVAQF
jgi:hypothetical protein